jgi:hypothetical protein
LSHRVHRIIAVAGYAVDGNTDGEFSIGFKGGKGAIT